MYNSHTTLSGTIFHKKTAESSHVLSILGYYRSCIQSAQSMLSIAQAIVHIINYNALECSGSIALSLCSCRRMYTWYIIVQLGASSGSLSTVTFCFRPPLCKYMS